MLRQIEWRLQNEPTTDPNVNIRIFCKRWSLILGCFLPVSIPESLNQVNIKSWFRVDFEKIQYEGFASSPLK